MQHPIPRLVLTDPSAGLLLQFLRWIDASPRTYAETMDAWRTSCPRISVWEDALADDLVTVCPGTTAQAASPVALTEAGRAHLRHAAAA